MSLSIWQHRQALFNRKPICIDDVVEAMVRVIDKQAQAEPNFDRANPTPANSAARYQIFNIGNGKRINLMDYVHALEQALGIKAHYQMLPMQPGDVETTNAVKLNAIRGQWLSLQTSPLLCPSKT